MSISTFAALFVIAAACTGAKECSRLEKLAGIPDRPVTTTAVLFAALAYGMGQVALVLGVVAGGWLAVTPLAVGAVVGYLSAAPFVQWLVRKREELGE